MASYVQTTTALLLKNKIKLINIKGTATRSAILSRLGTMGQYFHMIYQMPINIDYLSNYIE